MLSAEPTNRRGFLRLLGLGAAATAAAVVVPEPVRRFWQVPRNAPVSESGTMLNVLGEQYRTYWTGMANALEQQNKHYTELATVYGPDHVPGRHCLCVLCETVRVREAAERMAMIREPMTREEIAARYEQPVKLNGEHGATVSPLNELLKQRYGALLAPAFMPPSDSDLIVTRVERERGRIVVERMTPELAVKMGRV